MKWEEYRGRVAWSAVALSLGIYLGGGLGWLGGLLTWGTVIGLAQVVALLVAIVALARNTKAHRESHEQQRITNYLNAVGAYYGLGDEIVRRRGRVRASQARVGVDPEALEAHKAQLQFLERDFITSRRIGSLIDQLAPAGDLASFQERAKDFVELDAHPWARRGLGGDGQTCDRGSRRWARPVARRLSPGPRARRRFAARAPETPV